MILRQWSARIRTADEARYVAYIEETGAAHYAATAGNLGFQILTSAEADGLSTITTLSWWTDLEAVKRFAGEDYQRAQYYPEDDAFLVERTELVQHHVVHASEMRGVR
jgi:heme-degrading monooxygenase HmoA